MKQIFTLLFAAITFFTNAQNADLTFDQNWAAGTALGIPYSGVEPIGWATSNILTSPLVSTLVNPVTVSKSSTAPLFVSSPNAAKIITKKVNYSGINLSAIFGDTSGFMITGKIVGSSPILGYSYNVKSAQLDFQYNYQPTSAIDKGLVSVVFLKRNGAIQDTIATGYTVLSASPSTTVFQSGTVLMVYKNLLGSAPDTAIIGSASSIGNVKNLLGSLSIVAPAASINSTLYLDDFVFSGTVGLPKVNNEDKFVKVNFNAQSQALEVNTSGAYLNNTKINIYDITGKKMVEKAIVNSNHKLDMKDLQLGLYLYSITDKSDRLIKSGKFSVLN
jgi:Secretion system C-terminal sorting domain